MVPNTGQRRQMGCLGSCPGDEAERDGYRLVEEETACALSQYGLMMWAVCVVTQCCGSPEARLFAVGIFCVGCLQWTITRSIAHVQV